MSLFLVIKSSFYFYFIAYCMVAVLSLLVCLEDIDHSTIVCPRLGEHIKHWMLSLFRPFKPQLIDAFLALLLDLDYIYLSLLVFSGILVILWTVIYSIRYYSMIKMPLFMQKLVIMAFKVFCFIAFIIWIAIYSSGIGLNRLIEISKMIFRNPDKLDEYQETLQQFVNQRYEEIADYYF